MKMILTILLLLIPCGALAGSWGLCTPTIETTTDPKLRPGGSMCFEPASGDLDSTILPVSQCEPLDAFLEPDQSGAGTAISCAIRSCVTSTVSTNTCGIVRGVTLAGVPPNTELEGFAAEWIYADCSGTIGSETPRVIVHCGARGT